MKDYIKPRCLGPMAVKLKKQSKLHEFFVGVLVIALILGAMTV